MTCVIKKKTATTLAFITPLRQVLAMVCTTCNYHPFAAYPIHFFPVTADYEQMLSSINKFINPRSLCRFHTCLYCLPSATLSISYLIQGSTFTKQVHYLLWLPINQNLQHLLWDFLALKALCGFFTCLLKNITNYINEHKFHLSKLYTAFLIWTAACYLLQTRRQNFPED